MTYADTRNVKLMSMLCCLYFDALINCMTSCMY